METVRSFVAYTLLKDFFCQTKLCCLNEFFLESSRTSKGNNFKIRERPIYTQCYKIEKCFKHFFRTYALPLQVK